ncbi:hypothetical protein Z945_2697 [Sulfitobacter noctilucae]|uniref:DUF6497 family protein n=1 Tax=Sulfitobacter noctilucae TaxID=1342302 RepID=UPI00046A6227|nr:DUF6497 family protein [Sulfitobacter noctilucae]KIN61704.1 hypothetical protein Z945_2697 [Sulfitobacter noctilucae]
MKRLLFPMLVAAGPVYAADVPSGLNVALQEVLVDTVGDETWLRFRFIAPEISRDASGISIETAAADMTYLCEHLALDYIQEFALGGDMIVISLADRETEFGTADPDATQFFEAYRPVDNACIWEGL